MIGFINGFKNENSPAMEECLAFLQKEGDTFSHTHSCTQYILLDSSSDEHSVLPSLSHIVSTHQSTQKGDCQHLQSEEVVLEAANVTSSLNVKTLG